VPALPRIRLLAALVCLLGLALSPAAAQRGSREFGPRTGKWAHEESALPPDPRVVWGRLDNGLRYALLPHRGVPGRVAMKLLVLAGSMDERPDELGIAHFTEHMAFHGTREMDEAAMLSLFRRAGAEYGSDVNAITTYDYTAYSLDFRENDPALLAEGVRWFRGLADGVLFAADAIDRERRVIFAEKRSRDSLAERQMQASFPVVFRGLRFAQHAPIGTDQTLTALRREQFLEFYRRCYRADLMVFVAAGDLEVAAFEALVRERFGSVPRPAGPVPPRDEGRPDLRSLRAGVFRIPGVGSAETLAASVTPQAARPDSREAVVEAQKKQFVMELFSHRLQFLLPGLGAPQASFESLFRHDTAIASVRTGGPQWSDGILGVDLAVRETLRRGFEPAELERLRQRQLRLAALMAEQAPVLDPQVLCNGLVESITAHAVFLAPGVEHQWMREWLERLTPAEATATFRTLWNPDALAYHVGGDVPLQLRPEEVLKAVQRHRRGELPYLLPTPPPELAFTLRRPGPDSGITAERTLPALGATLVHLGNNVRVNLVPSRSEPGIVRAFVRVGAGLLTMPGRQPALKEFGLNTFLGSGTVYYQPDQIGQIIDRQLLEFSFDTADNDAFTFRGAMASDKLETFLGVATEFLRQPQFKAYAHKEERVRAYLSRSASAGGFAEGMRELNNHLFRGDARFMAGTPLDYISLGLAEVRRWMEEPLARGYTEVTIVGDVPLDAATAAVRRTLGTLPPRAAEKTFDPAPQPVRMTAPAGFRRIEFVGELNLGMVLGNWPVEGKLSMRDHVALEVLAKVLELRVRTEARDRRGLAYSPSAAFEAFGGFDNFALLRATVDCMPSEAQRVAQIVEDTAAALAAGGAGEEEFIGAQGIVRGQLRQAFTDNSFLVNVLKRLQEQPGRADDVVALKEGLVGEITLAEVNAWAAKLLPAANSRTAALVPKPFVGIFDTARP